MIETNKHLIDELNSRPEPVLPETIKEAFTVSTQTFSDQNEKCKKTISIEENDLNTTYCVPPNVPTELQKAPKNYQNYQTRSTYETYSLAKNDDYLINNFRPFNGYQHQHQHHHHHLSLSPKKQQSNHAQRFHDFEYENQYHQSRNYDYHQPRQKHNYTKYEESEYYPSETNGKSKFFLLFFVFSSLMLFAIYLE